MEKKNKPTMIEQKDGFVEISFSETMAREAIKKQVGECQAATCECCTPEFRKKVTKFDASGLKDNKIKIFGSISVKEVEKNVLSCSPKLKNSK